jgi:phosphoserine phosphatase RsbU/P
VKDRLVKILLLEDNPYDAELLMNILQRSGLDHEIHWVEGKKDFLHELHHYHPDVILSDHALPEFTSLDALKLARALFAEIPFILVTGAVSDEFAVNCMKAGMDDYILKDNLLRLPAAISNVFSRSDAKREKRETERLNEKLQVAYNKIEQNNRSITESLNYARLIQQAMLPDKSILDHFFKESFIIYKPKDIVSGDFYWFSEQEDELIIVVADCTGHGVPGALMSMIGSGLLNEVVNVRRVREPSEILKRLDRGIKKAFRLEHGGQNGDGMDISVVMINRRERKLVFAGANRHLLFFREGKDMEYIKGNNFGIGGLHLDQKTEFKSHTIPYSDGDVIYLYTDGYADQFGGARGKRMMTRNLFKILQRSLSFGIREQEMVLRHWLQKWQRNFEQTDDILLLGAEL